MRFNNNLSFQEDTEFNYRCIINSERILLYNKAYYNYFANKDSTTSNLAFKKINDILISYLMMHAYTNKDESKEVKQQLTRSLNNSLRMFMIESAANFSNTDIQAAKVRKALLQFLNKNEVKIRRVYPHIGGLVIISLIHIRILHLMKKLLARLRSN